MNWYSQVTNDLSLLPDFISYYEAELAVAKKEVKIFGNVEKNVAALPGYTEFRFAQLQEIEAVLNFLNIQLRKIKRVHFQKYLEAYNRALSSRDAEKYADGEDEVIQYEILINDVGLLRNKYLGILKALEQKSFSLSNITRLRTAGLENIEL
jgi:hypothetical protein